jgi:hypothetical protein
MGPSSVKTSTINNNGLTNVFSRTISRCYHHIKNTHILGLKHKFITSKVDSNKTKKALIKWGEQPSNWRGSSTIGTSQCVALVVRNNILKFHQDRTINDPLISDGNDYVKNPIFLSSLSVFGRSSLPPKLSIFLPHTAVKPASLSFLSSLLVASHAQYVTCSATSRMGWSPT